MLPKRVTGKLIQWRGKFGWIKPDTRIDHPAAASRGGKIYIGQEDVEGGELDLKSTVTFFVYEDDSGLGAMHCRPLAGAAKGKAQGKGTGVKRSIQKTGKMVQNGTQKGLSKHAQAWAVKGYGGAKVKGAKGGAKGGVAKGAPAAGKSGNAGANGNAARMPTPPPDKSTRERVLTTRITGRLMRWRGSYGFINPSEPVDHPEAEKHRGQVFLHQSDIQNGANIQEGIQVNFFLYADKDGLGAEHCMASKEQADPTEEEVEEMKNSRNRRRMKRSEEGAGDKRPRNKKGRSSMAQRTVAMQKSKLKKNNAKKAAGAGGSGEKKPGGPDLPRERISEAPIQGKVIDWRKKHGWIKPSDEIKAIEHESLKVRKGRIYVHENDVLSGAPLEKGQSVEFHLYVDESGVGAEECLVSA